MTKQQFNKAALGNEASQDQRKTSRLSSFSLLLGSNPGIPLLSRVMLSSQTDTCPQETRGNPTLFKNTPKPQDCQLAAGPAWNKKTQQTLPLQTDPPFPTTEEAPA